MVRLFVFRLFSFRRSIALCVAALFALIGLAVATPAEARPRHHHYRSHHSASHQVHRHRHHVGRHHVRRHHARRHRYHRARHHYGRRAHQRGATHVTALLHRALQNVPLNLPERKSDQGFASNVVAEARRYIGGNPTGRRSLWCARFMNFVLQRSGHSTTGSDMARSFASYGSRVSGPRVGAIAVMSRGRGGGHVGVVSGVDAKGNPIVVSGNHGHRVAESVYSKSRVYAYVMPN